MAIVASGDFFQSKLPYEFTVPVPTITVQANETSNITCYNINSIVLGSFQDMDITNSINCYGTANFNILKAQSYYVSDIISNSNLYANNIYLNGYQFHQISSNNVITYKELWDQTGMTSFSNIKYFPTGNLSQTNWFQQIGALASTAATLAALGVSLADKLKSIASPYDALKSIDGDLAKQIQDAGNNNGALDPTNSNPSVINYGWNNILKRPLDGITGSGAYVAMPGNLILNDSSLIQYDNDASTDIRNGTYVYTPKVPITVVDIAGSTSYLRNYSNVQSVNFGAFSISNDLTIRRNINSGGNPFFIDGISLCNQIIGNVKNINTNFITSPNLSNINVIQGGINSNILINTLSSNLASNIVNSNSFSFNGSVFTAPIVNCASNYTNSLQVLQITNSSNFIGSNISACNATFNTLNTPLFSFSGNQLNFTGDVNISGVLRASYISMNEKFPPINTSYDKGLYVDSTMVIDAQGRFLQNGQNTAAASMGTIQYNQPQFNSKISYNNPYSSF